MNDVTNRDTPVEAILARHMVARAIYVAPAVIALAWLVGGGDAAAAAALGVAVVVGNFLLAGAILSISARISLAAYHAAALFGFFLRLGLVTVSMLLLTRLTTIDRTALGLAAMATYLVLVTLEAVAMARGRERELDWT